MQALLARGADVELQANNGATAFSMASQQGHEEIVKALLAEGANVELQANNGATRLERGKDANQATAESRRRNAIVI